MASDASEQVAAAPACATCDDTGIVTVQDHDGPHGWWEEDCPDCSSRRTVQRLLERERDAELRAEIVEAFGDALLDIGGES